MKFGMRLPIMKSRILLLLVLMMSLLADDALSSNAAINGRILVADPGVGIGSFEADGSNFGPLVEGEVLRGTWSPDKSAVAYSILGAEGVDLRAISADGSDDHQVATNIQDFSWAPSGDSLAYLGAAEGLGVGCDAVWVIHVESGVKRQVSEVPGCDGTTLAWSPADDLIAFVDRQDGEGVDQQSDVYTVDVVTGDVDRLTDAPGVDRNPVWSPNGFFLLFESSRDHAQENSGAGGCFRNTEIYRMRSDGSRQKRLSGNLGNPDCDATWSPDGRKIAWTTYLRKRSDNGRPSEVKVAHRNGSRVQRITNGRERPSFGPDFSPNGRRIVFSVMTPEGSAWFADLFKARPNGAHRKPLTVNGVHYGRPDW